MAVWPQGQSPVAAGLAYCLYLYARSVCDTTAPLQLQLPLVALYKCHAFTFTIYLFACVCQANYFVLRSSRRKRRWYRSSFRIVADCIGAVGRN